jgi:hypothetical protein
VVRVNTLLRNIRCGRIASSPMRRSHSTKATSDTSAAPKIPRLSPEPQPHSRPCSATSSSGTTVPASRAAPR